VSRLPPSGEGGGGGGGGAELVLTFMADAVGAAARKLPECHERVHTLLQELPAAAGARAFSPLAATLLEQGLKVMRSAKRDAAQRACLGAYLVGCLATVLQAQAAPEALAHVLLRLTDDLNRPSSTTAAEGDESSSSSSSIAAVFAPLATLRTLAAAVAAAWSQPLTSLQTPSSASPSTLPLPATTTVHDNAEGKRRLRTALKTKGDDDGELLLAAAAAAAPAEVAAALPRLLEKARSHADGPTVLTMRVLQCHPLLPLLDAPHVAETLETAQLSDEGDFDFDVDDGTTSDAGYMATLELLTALPYTRALPAVLMSRASDASAAAAERWLRRAAARCAASPEGRTLAVRTTLFWIEVLVRHAMRQHDTACPSHTVAAALAPVISFKLGVSLCFHALVELGGNTTQTIRDEVLQTLLGHSPLARWYMAEAEAEAGARLGDADQAVLDYYLTQLVHGALLHSSCATVKVRLPFPVFSVSVTRSRYSARCIPWVRATTCWIYYFVLRMVLPHGSCTQAKKSAVSFVAASKISDERLFRAGFGTRAGTVHSVRGASRGAAARSRGARHRLQVINVRGRGGRGSGSAARLACSGRTARVAAAGTVRHTRRTAHCAASAAPVAARRQPAPHR